MTFDTYNPRRRWFEVGFWLLFLAINVVANSIVENLEIARVGNSVARWEPWVWECTSATLWLALLPVMLLFDRRFPLARPYPPRYFLYHLAFTLPYSLLHVLGMIGLRELAYFGMGGNYAFGNWPRELFYEYLKDFRTYAGLLAIIYLYRLVLRRWQGEASLPDRDESDPAPADRFLVRKLGKEFLVKVSEIDWLEASGNYVNLHAHGRVYPLRDTMTGMETRLAGQGFVRVHRGAMLNLDRVTEIEPFDTGDARARLVSGETVPISRRYRAQLKERLG